MANIYVSPLGAGDEGGSNLANAMPWATFEAGALTTLNPGDTVYCADGTYTRTSTITISRDGTGTAGTYTSTAPITFRYATTSRGPHFQGPDYSGGPGTLTSFRIFTINGTDIQLIGLKISRGPAAGVLVGSTRSAVRCLIEDCYILRNGMISSDSSDGGEGVMISGYGNFCTVKSSLLVENREHHVYASGGVDDVMIGGPLAADGNIFRYNGYDWDSVPAKIYGTSAIQAHGSGGTCYRITVQNNRIYYSSNRGVLFLETEDSTISDNYIYGNGQDQILLSNTCANCTVSGNQVASQASACIEVQGSTGTGHTITGNRFWTKATNNSGNVGVDWVNTAKIASSANNVFHHAGPSVARDSPSVFTYYNLAGYKAQVSDTTSTEVTDGTISQFDAAIQAWINAGGLLLTPPDPDVDDTPDPPATPVKNPYISGIDFLRDQTWTGGLRGGVQHLFTWVTTPTTVDILLIRPCATLTARARMTATVTERARLAGTLTERARMTASLTRRGCTD